MDGDPLAKAMDRIRLIGRLFFIFTLSRMKLCEQRFISGLSNWQHLSQFGSKPWAGLWATWAGLWAGFLE